MPQLHLKFLAAGALALLAATAHADVECKGWGAMQDFRFNGELMNLTSNLRIVSAGATSTLSNQSRVQGARDGAQQTYTGAVGATPNGRGQPGGAGPAVNFRMTITDTAPDTSTFDIQLTPPAAAQAGDGSFFDLTLTGADFGGGTLETTPATGEPAKIALNGSPAGSNEYRRDTLKSLTVTSGPRKVELIFAVPTPVVITQQRGGRGPAAAGIGVSIDLAAAANVHTLFTLKATRDVDSSPATVALDPEKTGPPFLGVGGNFRLQSQQDAAHIAYNLENLRLAWSRVAMPLSMWQTDATMDPVAAAAAGRLNQQVRQAMEMAQTLAKKKIPIVISDWNAPNWAIVPGSGDQNAGAGGIAAKVIAPEMWPAMHKAIVSYLVYLKTNYQAEPDLFSFNEADMGIDVKLSPQDQDALIKQLGAAMAAAGLKTKMLLGDTGNPTPKQRNYNEIAAADAEAVKYIGAVSYHSWTGGSDQQLAYWGKLAQQLKVPLMVTEGGTDPDSYKFTGLFMEPWYALDEINLYVRCMNLSQPASILHWQLTQNYSVLSGGGRTPLQPTERFFNLKQLNLTPPEAPAIGARVDKPHVTAAVYGDKDHGYAIHLVNTGAARTMTITGLPAGLKQLDAYTTDAKRMMVKGEAIPTSNGTAKVTLDKLSYVTLVGK